MRCSVMQPTYLPWAGYFNLIALADVFVFLDDAQYSKNSFHNRNQYLQNGEAGWITVPVKKGSHDKKIAESLIDASNPWAKKHVALLENVYNSHLYFKDFFPSIKFLFDEPPQTIGDLNIKLIMAIAGYLGFKPKFVRSSELNIKADRTARLVKICEHFNCDEYLSPAGAKEYLMQDGDFSSSPIKLEFQSFVCENYAQKNARKGEFVSHLSIIDVIANLGRDGARDYVLNGFVP